MVRIVCKNIFLLVLCTISLRIQAAEERRYGIICMDPDEVVRTKKVRTKKHLPHDEDMMNDSDDNFIDNHAQLSWPQGVKSRNFTWDQNSIFELSENAVWPHHDRALAAYIAQKQLLMTPPQQKIALTLLIKHNNANLCDTLLARYPDMDLNASCYDAPFLSRQTFLSGAQTVPVAQVLFKHGARIDKDEDALFNAVRDTDNLDLMSLFCQKGAPVKNRDGITIFHHLVWFLGYYEIEKQKPLHEIAHVLWESLPQETCYELLKTRVNVYGRRGTPLALLAEHRKKVAIPDSDPRSRLYSFWVGKIEDRVSDLAPEFLNDKGPDGTSEDTDVPVAPAQPQWVLPLPDDWAIAGAHRAVIAQSDEAISIARPACYSDTGDTSDDQIP